MHHLNPFPLFLKLHSAQSPVHTHTQTLLSATLPHQDGPWSHTCSHLHPHSRAGTFRPTPTTLSCTSLLWTPNLSSKRPSKHVFCCFSSLSWKRDLDFAQVNSLNSGDRYIPHWLELQVSTNTTKHPKIYMNIKIQYSKTDSTGNMVFVLSLNSVSLWLSWDSRDLVCRVLGLKVIMSLGVRYLVKVTWAQGDKGPF